jgi:acyl dehydratase
VSGEPVAGGMALKESVIPGLSAAEIENYASVSGDDNPIHTDERLARKMGLDGTPVQGMFVMALVNTYLEDLQYFDRTQKLSIRFVAPALANRDIRISAKVMVVSAQNRTAILRIFLHQADQPVAMGEAVLEFTGT